MYPMSWGLNNTMPRNMEVYLKYNIEKITHTIYIENKSPLRGMWTNYKEQPPQEKENMAQNFVLGLDDTFSRNVVTNLG
ncbi:hypothetical protein [Flagellimonas onchidii]|uniref:hypothetical protein n=1 Tax=Flagellimonas onchidii TaxID=2562684 RepID=UPI0010A699D7|nr:hypothetical protein [Allomuricauda onchidii]